MTQLSNVLITDNTQYYQNKFSVIKTFDTCVNSKADVQAMKSDSYYFIPSNSNSIELLSIYGELKLELKFIRVAMPLCGRSKQKLHHSIASYFIPFNQVPYFFIQFPRKLFSFEFGNCSQFKQLPQYNISIFYLINRIFAAETI